MNHQGRNLFPVPLVVVLTMMVMVLSVQAENIDPGNDGSQFAYGENLGWINAEPGGDGGPGLSVSDFAVTGWMWSENAGWISLSCENTATCDLVDYGVVNDGAGVLTGLAWSGNAGWINFKGLANGVVIDPTTGKFDGNAWSENAGWITFASSMVPYKVQTGWTCDPPPVAPAGSALLAVDVALLSWLLLPGASGYDIMSGDLGTLTATGGDFSAASNPCLADNETAGDLAATGTPSLGEALWFLVRGANCGGSGTYDTGAGSQSESRDAEVEAAPGSCS